MKQIECKRVELWDGGDRHNFGFYIASTVPDDLIGKKHNGCLIRPEVLTVFDDLEEVAANDAKNLRLSAWNKLTPLERKALGLTAP
jgi:hypothetical protein